MNIKNIDLVAVPVTDQDASLKFYTEKLGFEVRLNIPHFENPSIRWMQLAPSGAATSMVLAPWVKPENFITFILETSSIEADYAELKAKGVNLAPLVTQPWGTSAMITDPDGNQLLLQQSTALPK
ncbi:MAG: VOC family protein [Anaerolineae bacterium]|nr:VOC family protein [Anaerolineae bacterium]